MDCPQVSRCGMIYMEPHMLGWKPVMISWMNTLPKTLNEENKELIRDLFERMEEALLQFIRKGGVKVSLCCCCCCCCCCCNYSYVCYHYRCCRVGRDYIILSCLFCLAISFYLLLIVL